jgi:protein SCO1/2
VKNGPGRTVGAALAAARPPVGPKRAGASPAPTAPLVAVACLTALLFAATALQAQQREDVGVPASAKLAGLEGVGIDQRLDQQVPLDLAFRDEAGRAVRLGDFFGKRPVVLALVYYDCPMLCTQVLNGLVSALGVVSFDAGREFDVVAVSFDPREKPADAATKKTAYLTRYRRPGAEAGWHFLTGEAASIAALTKAVGFRYRYDAGLDQFAHASAVFVLTPGGRVSRYFFGIEYAPKDLRLGLIEASDSRIGTPVDQILLYCFHYDPKSGKYGAAIVNIVRLAGGATVVTLALSIALMSRRARRLRAVAAESK